MKRLPKNVVPMPPDWRAAFQGFTMRSSFALALSQPMLEFLCATADGVHWDRRLYARGFGGQVPDNWIASSHSLVKRGLIERLTRQTIDTLHKGVKFEDLHLIAHYRLTPAGEALVELLKVTGIFIKADAAIEKEAR